MTSALVWIAVALAALGHGFLWVGVANRLHACGWARWFINFLTLLCGAALIGIPVLLAWTYAKQASPQFDPFVSRDWSAAYLWLCLLVAVASLAAKPWIESHRCDRRALLHWSADRLDAVKAIGHKPLHGPAARFLGSLPGNEALIVSIDRKRLAIPRLPVELEGLTIAHISDLHMTGGVGREYFDYVARLVNNLRPDVIAITGDIVEHEQCRSWLEPSLGQLCAPLGVYFILGNHDDLIDCDQTRQALMDLGLVCLSNRWLKVDWNGAAVTLGGNEAPWMPAPNLSDAPLATSGEFSFRLILSHSPDQFGWCQRADADLVLAGHTHGGQVQLPLLGVLASPSFYGTRYACGVFRRGNTVMHVTRGVGGETPLRWRCPPELALLELTAENG